MSTITFPNGPSARGINAGGIVGAVNVLDMGCRGDGLGDDGAQLAKIVGSDTLPSIGTTLIAPPGTYAVGTSVTIPAGVTLILLQGVSLTGAGAITVANGGCLVDLRNGGLAATRLGAIGTNIVAADIALSAGWGSTASFTIQAGSNDTRGAITITSSGTGQAANPTVTLTFHDGAYAAAPFAEAQFIGGTGITSANQVNNVATTTTLTMTCRLTPVAASTYILSWTVTF